jgi:dTDP-glucose 4,6-dehydratase
MKLFVTGGAGFIGSHFIRLILQPGQSYSVINYDKLTYAGNLANLESVASHPNYLFIKGDICDAPAAEAAMAGCDAVVHFATESHVDRSIYAPAPAIHTNIIGTFVLLEIAKKLALSKFVHISTDEVYGDLPPGYFASEESSLNPSSPYAASKAASDLLVLSFVRTYNFPAVILRASNNYGPNQFPEKFLPLLICNLLDGQPLPIYGDGLQQRNWLHVTDHCRAIQAALERGHLGEIYNVASPDIVENLTMAKSLLRLMQKPESLLAHVTDRPGHDRRYALNTQKIAAELDWRPQIPLEDGLRQTIAWYQSNPGWIANVRNNDYLTYYSKYYEHRDAALRDIGPFPGTHKLSPQE